MFTCLVGFLFTSIQISLALQMSSRLTKPNNTVSIDLALMQPFTYQFDSDENNDLMLQIDQSSNTSFCQIYQASYDFLMQPLLWANQISQQASTEEFHGPFVQSDIDIPVISLSDFVVHNGSTHIVSTVGSYQIFDQNNIEIKSFIKEQPLIDFKILVNADTTILVTNLAIEIMTNGKQTFFESLTGVDEIQEVAECDGKIFLALGAQGMRVYDYTLKDLNKTDYFAKHNITQPIKLYINKLFNLLLILDHIEGLSVFNITGSNFKLQVQQVPCDQCETFIQLDNNVFVLATDHDLNYFYDGYLIQTVDIFGIQNMVAIGTALILYGPYGVNLVDQTAYNFAGYSLVPLPQQVQKVQVVDDNIYVLTRSALFNMTLKRQNAELSCLANDLELVDEEYSFQVLATRTDEETRFYFNFEIHLETPLITRSNAPLVLGLVLGMLLLIIVLVMGCCYYNKKYKEDREKTYEQIKVQGYDAPISIESRK